MFSPRMDFEQWKPLTGRGDPLHNDPTYDYEPPVLERVHYWADDTKPEREHYPEKKSEVLMLGVSSRKPSVTSRQPPLPPPRRHQQFRPPPPKYEDFTYKLSDTYPMTILVPPPPPPPGHKPSLFILDDEETPISNSHIKEIISPLVNTKDTTNAPEKLTSMYALQEANLIYQSSSTSQNWILDTNETLPQNINNAVSSDYAGWGPTTPVDVYETENETHNLVSNDQVEIKHPYSFYRPMLSEAPPPPPQENDSLLHLSTFLPTALPPTTIEESTTSLPEATWPTERTTSETTSENLDYYEETPTEKPTTLVFRPTPSTSELTETPDTNEAVNFFSMLGPMMSMPIHNGPDRPEDNLYAHASENMQVFKERRPEDIMKLENMQTMQPPPPVMFTESTTASHKQPYHANSNIISLLQQNKPSLHTHDPYLHMRYTTPVSTTSADAFGKNKSTTEASAPMYLIIQGHSKVKTYSSKPKTGDDQKHATNNDILKPNETNEVKHLHPKEKLAKKLNITEVRKSKAQNLKALVDHGLGSIEIHEADLGIKYDVSDGSDVPLELYRQGIVDSDENDYKSSRKATEKRVKRQIDLQDLIPFDEDSIEEFVYNFFEGKKNETSFTGLIAQAVTSDAANAVDELEDDEDSSEVKDEDR